jgi:hypothetical protein
MTRSIGTKPNGGCGTGKRPVNWATKGNGKRQSPASVRFPGRLVNPADAGCPWARFHNSPLKARSSFPLRVRWDLITINRQTNNETKDKLWH